MDHFLVCTVRKNDEGREEASLDGFVQNCDLAAAKQYFQAKKKKESKLHHGSGMGAGVGCVGCVGCGHGHNRWLNYRYFAACDLLTTPPCPPHPMPLHQADRIGPP